MGANGNINDLELQKFMDLAGEMGIRVHILHGDNWLPSVANLAALPGTGNTTGDVRQALDTGIPYRWNGSAWAVWISGSGVTWGSITGTLSSQTDLQTALNAKMGSGAYVLTSRDSALTNQVNLGALTTGILKQTVSAGISTFTIVTDNSGNWDTAYTHSQIVTGNPHGTTKADISLGNVDNTSDVNKPVSTAQATADTAALNAAKAYADGLVVGLLDDRGNFNASANTWPSSGGSGTAGAILKGDLWTISVAGTLGGVAVTAGDVIRALIDTPGTTAANWAISEKNFGYTAENSANKDASGGYAGLTLFKLNMRNAANSITSWFTNTNTAARTYTLPDKDGTVAMTSDITGTNSNTNTGDVTLAGTPNYITIVGQVITRSLIDLTAHVTGLLPFANIASVGTGTVMYRKTAATGAMEAQSLATLKTDLGLTGSNSGDQTSIVGITGTMAQFDTAVSDGNIVYQGQALGTPASGNASNMTADGTDQIGFRNIPQNSQSVAYTAVLADAGKHIYHPSADTTARTWTIPANASVAYPIGTALTFVNDTSGGVITIAITTDTLVLAGAGTTGSRTLAANGVATAIKVTSTRWIISGTNLT